MKKKWMSAMLCVLLIAQMVCPAAGAKSVYFTGVEENILPLSDSTMPFWYNSYLYVPCSIFTGTVRNSLNVGHTVASDGSWVAFYRGNSVVLFKENIRYGEDTEGKLHYPGAVKRNNMFFVPVSVIAEYFNLQYSSVKVENGHLAWLRTKDFVLTDRQFADAASGVMRQRYTEYTALNNPQDFPLKENASEQTENLTPEIVSGKNFYLCFQASSDTGQMLDILDRYDAVATIFCEPAWMEENHDLLRRIDGTGHQVGILADGLAGSVLEQLRAGNQAMEQATGMMTRLVRIENASDEQLERVIAAGFCPSASKLKLSRYTLRTSQQANALFRNISSTEKDSFIWLENEIQSGGLVSFLSQVNQAKEFGLPLRETTRIS